MIEKKEFGLNKMIVLPKSIINELKGNNLTNSLFVTDIGYYQNANKHFIERKSGSLQHILIYCIDGSGWVEIDDKKQIIQKNQYIIITPNTPHRYGSNHKNPWSIYWIHFTGSKSHLFVNHPNKKIEIDLATNARYSDRIILFDEIFYNLEMGSGVDNLEYANICLWHMLGSFRYLSQYRKINELNEHDKIEQSIRFMKNNLSKKLSLESISSHVELSVSQFCVLFKKKTSRAPIAYLTHLKIQSASQLLDFSTLQINEIAQKVGYQDPFYFSRIFTKTMGKSPKAYRNSKKG